jgi:hypothetical protein
MRTFAGDEKVRGEAESLRKGRRFGENENLKVKYSRASGENQPWF